MSPAPPVRDFLQQSGVSWRLVSHAPTESLEQAAQAAQVPSSAVVRGVLLTDPAGPLLVVLPLEHLLDFRALHDLLGRDLKPASMEMVRDVFNGCAAGCVPPLADAFSVPAVVDETLQDFDVVFFDAGRHPQRGGLDQALLSEGGQLDDPASFVHRLNDLLLELSKPERPDYPH